MILAIDPGPEESAVVLFGGDRILKHFKAPNKDCMCLEYPNSVVVIEMIASYGMPVGKEVFETCLWIGRFIEYFESREIPTKLVYRREVKLHICGSPRAKDSNIRQALIDRFGKPGTKKNQGLTYGLKADEWAALALAVYFADTQK